MFFTMYQHIRMLKVHISPSSHLYTHVILDRSYGFLVLICVVPHPPLIMKLVTAESVDNTISDHTVKSEGSYHT